MNSEPEENPHTPDEPNEPNDLVEPPHPEPPSEQAREEPLRLHPSSMIFEAIKQARSLASAAVIPGLALLFGSGLSALVITLVIFGGVVVIIFSVVWGFLAWRATTYAVRGGAFYLKSGVIQKNERTIPLDHVQSVDTVQGFIQRALAAMKLLDVVEVRLETAGGGSSEADASLTSLTRTDATELRRRVERTRRERAGVSPDEEPEEPRPTLIRKLTTRELLIAGATSGQIGATAAIVAFASQFFDDLIERFVSERFVNDFVQTVAPNAFLVVALAVFVFGLVAWLLSIAGTVLSYAGFTLSRSADGKYLNISRGLIKRYEATVPLTRVQAVRISESIFRQPFGLAMLRVESAGYGAEDSGVSTTLFPLLPKKQATKLLKDILPEFAVSPPLNPPPRRALRRYILRSALPLVVIIALAAVPLYFTGILGDYSTYYVAGSSILLALAVLYGIADFRAAGWAFVGDCFVSRNRSLARTTSIAPRRRLQSRSVIRNPFQRRLDLATIRARVASGGGGATFEVIDIDAKEARDLIPTLGPKPTRE